MPPFLSKKKCAHMDDVRTCDEPLQSTENAPGLEESVGNSE